MPDPATPLLVSFRLLLEHFGPQRWWPGESGFPTVIGAILTQNTAWTNVETALVRLGETGPLTPGRLATLERERLEELIRPAGYFRQKARALQEFAEYLLDRHGGDLRQLLSQPLAIARPELLARRGIGPETADAILLYAGGHPTFVVDAYTVRWLDRMGLLPGKGAYESVRRLFMTALPADAGLFNEYHALLVALGKNFCRKSKPLCRQCPLRSECPTGRQG